MGILPDGGRDIEWKCPRCFTLLDAKDWLNDPLEYVGEVNLDCDICKGEGTIHVTERPLTAADMPDGSIGRELLEIRKRNFKKYAAAWKALS